MKQFQHTGSCLKLFVFMYPSEGIKLKCYTTPKMNVFRKFITGTSKDQSRTWKREGENGELSPRTDGGVRANKTVSLGKNSVARERERERERKRKRERERERVG